MLVSLTVGKVDAGVTVLLTQDKRLIEFPSILLPPNISSGSIVDITVGRNSTSEAKTDSAFRTLQDQIYDAFGAAEPAVPVLRCRNATQTSVVLEWDPVELATADLISLALYRNGQKAGNIPKPLSMHSTKISGLAVDSEYTFHLVLRTTAGTHVSEKVHVKTHKLTDLSGITITAGIMPAPVRESLAAAVDRIGAKLVDGVRIDTTHFVTTEGRGLQWEKAQELNIPVVRPEWVDACEKNGRILGVAKFYLDAMRPGPPTPSENNSQKDLPATPPQQQQQESQQQQQQTEGQEQRQQQAQAQEVPKPSEDDAAAPATAAQNGDGATAATATVTEATEKDDADSHDDSDEEDDDGDKDSEKIATGDHAEQKTRASEQDEQKVRLEDKEDTKTLPIRDGQANSDNDEEDAPDPKVSSSRASFQNVEL